MTVYEGIAIGVSVVSLLIVLIGKLRPTKRLKLNSLEIDGFEIKVENKELSINPKK